MTATVSSDRAMAAPAQSAGSTTAAQPVLRVRDLAKHFPVKKGVLAREVARVKAVDGISFSIGEGETLGLVGESGCGKSTVGKLILRLIDPTAGTIEVAGQRIDELGRGAMKPFRRELQVVFQDPYSSLNPRMRAVDIVGEPLRNFEKLADAEIEKQVAELFDKVGLRSDQLTRFPHEFSGGQRQRLVIARALALRPKLIVCDEPVSALDVSVQAQVINLLIDLQRDFGLSYLFIAHDLAVVEHISHRVAVMYLGRIVEIATKEQLYAQPQHPYTQALLSAVPVPDPMVTPNRMILQGDVPSPMRPPTGCHFHTRCPFAEPRCKAERPLMREVAPGQFAACHLRDGPAVEGV
jgi:oligopeptide/dipeptide ABC transporter ATP-binding protein